ncbi:bifunctional 2-polyprenyl-6-hydroxyphenol methylase/3-demethylubiquinol 3-O-methyltransferase UbiG [Thalassobium sp. R2A62]|uniref:class I SAM-dependent methyltransferase n=1 Tax=Thalassobium sp. R2A62 TaxID=633131 RepID=UPI0001B1CC0C|nr:class I SAM-dependent methyltransferase [Thalassobium sp. R2A62]EET47695.1 methyltransferase type 11 [Thalassobium sp. R2A62]
MGQNVSDTVKYYDDNADVFVAQTVKADVTGLYVPFLSKLPKRARILDAGSGSGRDTKAFRDMGHDVVAIDASKEMVEATRRLSNGPAIHSTFLGYSDGDQFDGIWACASLLHVPSTDLPKTLNHLSGLLNDSGWMFASFKIGESEQIRNGRFFNDMDVGRLDAAVDAIQRLSVVNTWKTEDVRPERDERWLNVLLSKEGAEENS